MTFLARIPGTKSGSTIRNSIIYTILFLAIAMALFLAPIILALAVGLNYRNAAGKLSRLPGINGSGGWKPGLIAGFYGLFILGGAMNVAGISGGTDESTNMEPTNDDLADSPTSTLTATPTSAPTPSPTVTELDSDSSSGDQETPLGYGESTETPTPSFKPERPPSDEVPEYYATDVYDVNYADVVRIVVRIQTDYDITTLSKNEYRLIAQDAAAQVTDELEVNSIVVFFDRYSSYYGEYQAYARVYWTPYGEWGRAGDVATGWYRNHEYSVKVLGYQTPENAEDSDTTSVPGTSSPVPDTETPEPVVPKIQIDYEGEWGITYGNLDDSWYAEGEGSETIELPFGTNSFVTAAISKHDETPELLEVSITVDGRVISKNSTTSHDEIIQVSAEWVCSENECSWQKWDD